MNIQSVVLVRSMIRLLVQYMEICNKISEEDFKQIVLSSQRSQKNIKGVVDNVQRGNVFMTIFFVREILESIMQDGSLK